MGLLDPKSRILDVVLTEQAREALARSSFKAAYYSLSDAAGLYDSSLDDATHVYAEAASDLPQDVISLLTDDSGHITRLRSTALSGSVYGGQILQGAYQNEKLLSGSAFASTAGLILSSSLENLQNNFILGTIDQFFEDEEFKLGPSKVNFSLNGTLTDTGSGNALTRGTANVSTLDSFFQDPLLSHIPNFKYLPPVNKRRSENDATSNLGEYSALGGNIQMDYKKVKEEINVARNTGNLRTFRFDPAPRENNVHLQFFEQTSSGMSKLDVIDFGTHRGDTSEQVRVLFVGKVYQDDFNAETFVRLFTVTME